MGVDRAASRGGECYDGGTAIPVSFCLVRAGSVGVPDGLAGDVASGIDDHRDDHGAAPVRLPDPAPDHVLDHMLQLDGIADTVRRGLRQRLLDERYDPVEIDLALDEPAG